LPGVQRSRYRQGQLFANQRDALVAVVS
jgi:hypothetical protein